VAFLYDTRLKFLVDGHDGGKGAPMSCGMVYWGERVARFEEVFLPYGAPVDLRGLQGKAIGVPRDEARMLLFASAHGVTKRRARQ
jgi:hypothetical protein